MKKILSEKVTTVVDPATKKAIGRLAVKQQRSEGAVVRIAIRAYLETVDHA